MERRPGRQQHHLDRHHRYGTPRDPAEQGERDAREHVRLRRTALQPEKIERLVELLDDNHGYHLYQAVSRLKEALSSQTEADFLFEAGSVRIELVGAGGEVTGLRAPVPVQAGEVIDATVMRVEALERFLAEQMVRAKPDDAKATQQAYANIFWALLNSPEFVLCP